MRDDTHWIRRTIELAERGWGRVQPNPLVGAVVVRDGAAIGEGWHERYGEAHAEVNALRGAGSAAAGATLYVSLEPCNHFGRTPPCTEAILAARIARVVYGAHDTNPKAQGGAERLRAQGVEVHGGVLEADVRAQNAIFFYATETRSTFVALKLALTRDAQISAAEGTRTQLTGAEANLDVQRLRAGFDAIMVGARTAQVDDPLLTVRGDIEPRSAPARIVIDSRCSLRPDSRLMQTTDIAPVWVFTTGDADTAARSALERGGARVFTTGRDDYGVDLHEVMGTLWHEGVRSVLCEGGAQLGKALLASDLVQRVYTYDTPVAGGEQGVDAATIVNPITAEDGVWRHDARLDVVLGPDVRRTFDRRRG